jgi:hypothetical protein
MMRTLCFSFLVLASSQMVMSSQSVVQGTLFGEWHRDAVDTISEPRRTLSCLILPSAPFKHGLVCASGFVTGATFAMGVSPFSPLLLLAAIPSYLVGAYIIHVRIKELEKQFYDFNTTATPADGRETFDRKRTLGKTVLCSQMLPIFIGIAGVVLASRYQLKLPLR